MLSFYLKMRLYNKNNQKFVNFEIKVISNKVSHLQFYTYDKKNRAILSLRFFGGGI